MANPNPKIHLENLKPVEAGKKGGVISGEVRREKKRLREAIQTILDLPCIDSDLSEILKKAGIKQDTNNGIALAMALKAMQGDKQAADWVRDTAGEKPSNDIDVKGGSMVIAIKGEDQL